MTRRGFSALLCGLVACFFATAVERVPLGAQDRASWNGAGEFPALCPATRSDARVGRPIGSRGADGPPQALAVSAQDSGRGLLRPTAEISGRPARDAIRAGQPVSSVRSPRGPPSRRA